MVAVVTRNYWTDAKCAKAFWGQHDLPPFRKLIADTLDWADPRAGERWLDLGCGGGALTRHIWERTAGQVAEIVGLDCAEQNHVQYGKLRQILATNRITFLCHNFSDGLELFPDESFDHAISGLSISYAEYWDENRQAWTQAAYDRVLEEVERVLRPGGRFVFSVNVPEPSWGRVGWSSLSSLFSSKKPLLWLKNSWRMMRYGVWLKQQARLGRFHYLPHQEITAKLQACGYVNVEHRLSYAKQAYVFRAIKPK